MKTPLVRAALAAALALATATGFAQGGGSPPGATLESLLEIARQNNPELAAMRHEADAARERVEQADALPDPRLKLELQDVTRAGAQNPTLWPSDVGSTRYTLSQELPWFGTRALKRTQADSAAQGAQSATQGVWADLALRIKLAYVQLYFLSRNQRLNEEILALMRQLEQMAQARYASGLAPQQDAIRAQTEQSAMRGELIALQSELRQARVRLNGWLARPAQAELADPQELRSLPAADALTAAELEQRARANNPQLAADEAKVRSADAAQALVFKGRYPTFAVGVAPTQYQNDVKTWDLMLEMNIPLWQGTRRAQERESLAMLEAARTRREATLNQVLSDLNENLAALQSAQQTEALVAGSLLPQAELTLQAALVGYETGRVDFATVLDAQRQIRQARQSRIKAQAEGQARWAQIERLMGEEP